MIAFVYAYPIEEQPNENRDNLLGILGNIPDDLMNDVNINDIINELKSKFVSLKYFLKIFLCTKIDLILPSNQPSNVIDAPTLCPPGTKLHGGICRPVF